MNVALTVWENRISPVFDSARMLLIAQVEDGIATNRRYESLDSESPHIHAARLLKLEVDVVICGAISQFFANMIKAQGIEVIPFIAGEMNQVLNAYLQGKLIANSFQMPGVRMGRRNRFHGGRK